VVAGLKAVVKMANWIAEEWFRQLVVWYHARLRGRLVLFDRHFYADYHGWDVAPGATRPLPSRIHGRTLGWYPKPDLTIYLDAPPEVLLERKGEGTIEFLQRRRQDYLRLRDVLPNYIVLDADRPPEAVADDVRAAILGFHQHQGANT
jgi:thymidylate kinase